MAVMWRFRCVDCQREHAETHADYCVDCGAPVLACADGTEPRALASGGPGVWRYHAHLPPVGERHRLTLGEAETPLVEAPELAGELGVGRLLLLCEQLNPTGSFKDRALALTVGKALERGAPGVVCASSGNAAGSAAAYAARAGLPAVILVPEAAPLGKLGLARAYGATTLRVAGDYSRCFALGRELSTELGFVNVATTYVHPYNAAAYRSIAFDIVRQFGDAVDRVMVPTGAGPLVHGVVTGWQYLRERGDVRGIPRVDVVQPEGCAPVVAAFRAQRSQVVAWPEVATAVSGIDDPLRGYPGDGTVTLRSMLATDGSAVAVSDTEVFASGRWLATAAGQFVEPAAASALAGVRALVDAGQLGSDETVVCLLTGHGLKTLRADDTPVPVVACVAEAAAQLVADGLAVT